MHLSTAVGMDAQQDTDQHHHHQPDGTVPACVGTPGSLLTVAKEPICLCPLLTDHSHAAPS